MFAIPCVIFAGGKSSRMGEDKALLPFDGFATLTEYQYTRLSKLFQSVYISTKESSKFHFSANFIEDDKTSDTFAPTAGFIASFQQLKTECFFVISVDAPFIGETEIQKLIDADKKNNDATLARTAHGLEPMCGIYHKSLYPHFLDMQKNSQHKLNALLQQCKIDSILFENQEKFLNLNHPHEYSKALEILCYNDKN